VVVLTKCDLVDAERWRQASAEVRRCWPAAALAMRPCSRCPRHRPGLAALRAHLRRPRGLAAAPPAAGPVPAGGRPQLHAGGHRHRGHRHRGGRPVAVGDRLLVSPRGLPVRVRGMHAQNREAEPAWPASGWR
jgi:selenocysteine-specific elongation factor